MQRKPGDFEVSLDRPGRVVGEVFEQIPALVAAQTHAGAAEGTDGSAVTEDNTVLYPSRTQRSA